MNRNFMVTAETLMDFCPLGQYERVVTQLPLTMAYNEFVHRSEKNK